MSRLLVTLFVCLAQACTTTYQPVATEQHKSIQTPLIQTHQTPVMANRSIPVSNRMLAPIDPNRLTVSSGHIRKTSATHFTIIDSMRGEYRYQSMDDVEVAFTYLGHSAKEDPLASGEMRRQIGLKLRAQDTCNVVYVMWHIEPTQGIHVSVKHNPGHTRHEECGDRGYVNIQPSVMKSVLPIRLNETRTLRATIEGGELLIYVDGGLVWQGALPNDGVSPYGMVGIRSDNGTFDAELRL